MRSRRRLGRRPVGSFGAVSGFSLSKHFPGRGGVLRWDHEISRPESARLQAICSCYRDRWAAERPTSCDPPLRTTLDTTPPHGNGGSRAPGGTAGQTQPVASAAASAAAEARRASGDLDQFDPWMETAYPDYRMRRDRAT